MNNNNNNAEQRKQQQTIQYNYNNNKNGKRSNSEYIPIGILYLKRYTTTPTADNS